MAVRYYDLIRDMKNPFNHRLRLVAYARQKGIKTAARERNPALGFGRFRVNSAKSLP